jgi:pilus assembly protein Flp/PilA
MKLNRMDTSLKVFFHSSSGATAIEYALIATLICVAIIGALTLFASNMGIMFDSISTAVDTAT